MSCALLDRYLPKGLIKYQHENARVHAIAAQTQSDLVPHDLHVSAELSRRRRPVAPLHSIRNHRSSSQLIACSPCAQTRSNLFTQTFSNLSTCLICNRLETQTCAYLVLVTGLKCREKGVSDDLVLLINRALIRFDCAYCLSRLPLSN
jgi:hypothetical protein